MLWSEGSSISCCEFDGNVLSFRHALTREAIVERLLPQRRQALAGAALQAVDAAHPEARRDVAGSCRGPGDPMRRRPTGCRTSDRLRSVGDGREALLPLPIAVLGGARALGHLEAGPVLVEALALAGRVDEAVAVRRSGHRRRDRAAREVAEVHLLLAHAAVAAARWQLATLIWTRLHVSSSADLERDVEARIAVLEAEVALAGDEVDRASLLASHALSAVAASPEVRCHALEVLGRVERFSDRSAARGLFEQALTIAHDHDLPLWQVRAMHELGTIDMFDHAGSDRLEEARRTAGEFGALSTAAVSICSSRR